MQATKRFKANPPTAAAAPASAKPKLVRAGTPATALLATAAAKKNSANGARNGAAAGAAGAAAKPKAKPAAVATLDDDDADGLDENETGIENGNAEDEDGDDSALDDDDGGDDGGDGDDGADGDDANSAAAGSDDDADADGDDGEAQDQKSAAEPHRKPAAAAAKPTKPAAGAKPVASNSAAAASAAANSESGAAAAAPAVEKTFAELGLVEELCKATAALGWKMPSAIQSAVLPYALAGRDIIGLAETGSGKTGAFALPVIQSLLNDPKQPRFYALVMAPTRELAVQINEQFTALGKAIGLKCAVVMGGMDRMDEALALAQRPHVLVATPGRVVDHLENTKGFNLKNLKFLVLDEADRLLDMDFEEPIETILRVIPRERRTYLFSATMTTKVAKLQRAALVNPEKVQVSTKYGTVKGLIQQFMFIPFKYKDCYLAYILNEYAGQSTIIFTGTCDTTQRVAIMLRAIGFGAVPLHGKMTQPKRLGALNKFKSGDRAGEANRTNILIATDVASRGLDIKGVDLVINYDVAAHGKDYIHRVGRTARAGAAGRAISLVSQYDVELFQRIEKLLGHTIPRVQPEAQTVLAMLDSVSEAQRQAALEMRELQADKKNRKKGGKSNGDDDDGGGGGGGRGGGGGGRGGGRGGGGGRGRGSGGGGGLKRKRG